MVTIQVVLKNEFGEFIGKKASMTPENYKKLLDISKGFFNSVGFELTCEDGSYIVFPPEIVKKSILIIRKIEKIEDKKVMISDD
jgi:hypothetical protein